MQIKEKPARGSTPMPDHIMISISDDPKTTMSVTWRTSIDVKHGYVLVREDGADIAVLRDISEFLLYNYDEILLYLRRR